MPGKNKCTVIWILAILTKKFIYYSVPRILNRNSPLSVRHGLLVRLLQKNLPPRVSSI